MKIDYQMAESFKNDKAITAQIVLNNYDANIFVRMVEKLEKFVDRLVVQRASPIRFRLICPHRGVLKSVMKELAPETAALRLTFHIPQNSTKQRLHNDYLNYLETINTDNMKQQTGVPQDLVCEFMGQFTMIGKEEEISSVADQIAGQQWKSLDAVAQTLEGYCNPKKFKKELEEVKKSKFFNGWWE